MMLGQSVRFIDMREWEGNSFVKKLPEGSFHKAGHFTHTNVEFLKEQLYQASVLRHTVKYPIFILQEISRRVKLYDLTLIHHKYSANITIKSLK